LHFFLWCLSGGTSTHPASAALYTTALHILQAYCRMPTLHAQGSAHCGLSLAARKHDDQHNCAIVMLTSQAQGSAHCGLSLDARSASLRASCARTEGSWAYTARRSDTRAGMDSRCCANLRGGRGGERQIRAFRDQEEQDPVKKRA
jgi:hypothetical protein